MPTRRNFLRTAFGAAASVPLLGLAGTAAARPAAISNGVAPGVISNGTPNAAASVLPMTFVNNTGLYSNSSIWMYVVGSNTSGQQAYVTADGTLVPVTPSLNGPSGYADLSIPFAANGNTTLNLPTMSGRIYFSINQKLQFKVVTDGNGNPALQYPAGWVSSDPSYSVLHDWIEFTFINGMYCNTTMVDMFSIPLAIQLNGTSQQTTGTLVPGGRNAIFSGIAAQSGFGQLVLSNGLRVLAPGHGIDAGLFSSTYFDSYVSQVWSNYANNDLDVTINSTTYTGRVSGNSLVFNNGGGTFAKPTTSDIFYCAGALAPPAGAAGPVAADLGAAFNRSTVLSYPNQPVTTPADFYQNSTTNHYSRIIHQNTVDGKAYGFPFDDVGSFASYVQDGSPTSMTVTLTPFNDSGSGGSTPTLLSQGRPATASSLENSSYPASNAVDGSTSTRWSSQFADPQWLQVDLGAVHSIGKVTLVWEAAYGKAYQLQTSADGNSWTTVYSTSAGGGGTENISLTSASGRYVRMYGTQRGTPYGYSLWEFQVSGT